jgi:hypothetical protein
MDCLHYQVGGSRSVTGARDSLHFIRSPVLKDTSEFYQGDGKDDADAIKMITSVNPVWWEKGVLALRRRLLGAMEVTRVMERVERDQYADTSSSAMSITEAGHNGVEGGL